MSEPTELSPAFEPSEPPSGELPEGQLLVQSVDLDAQGVARKPDGKVVFIDHIRIFCERFFFKFNFFISVNSINFFYRKFIQNP